MSDTINATPVLSGAAQTAFVANLNGQPYIYVVQDDTARQVAAVNPSELGEEYVGVSAIAQLAPDGHRLAYCLTTTTNEKPLLKVLNLREGTSTVLMHSSGKERFGTLAWKPDSSQIAFTLTAAEDSGGLNQIWLVEAGGGTPSRLEAAGNEVLQLLGWEADGSRVHFTRRVAEQFAYSAVTVSTAGRGELQDIYLPDDLDDEQNVHVTSLTHASAPGRAVTGYVLSTSPYLQNCKSTPVLVAEAGSGQLIRRIPNDGAVTGLSFSPDLTLLAYTVLHFPPGSGTAGGSSQQALGRGLRVVSLTGEESRDLVPVSPANPLYEIVAWAGDKSGLFISQENGTVEFINWSGERTGVVDAPVSFEAGFNRGTIAGAVINLEVPYIHQLDMTPPDFNGNAACGPTSCTMAAAYYGKLTPRGDTFGGHFTQYGWYISSEFSSPANGKVFNRRTNDPSGRMAAGAYGHCCEEEMGWAWRMEDYLRQLGLKAKFRDRVSGEVIKSYLDQGKPVVLSTTIKGFGHLVLVKGYLPDGRLICNDPFWAKPDAGEIVYNWGQLGSTPYMITIDDDPPDSKLPARAALQSSPAPVEVASAPPPTPTPAPPPLEPGTGHDTLAARFKAAYDRNGGAASLGQPGTKVYAFNQRWLQEFSGGSRGTGVLVVDDRHDQADYQPQAIQQPAFAVFGSFFTTWRDTYGGSAGTLGSPLSDEFVNDQGERQQNFEGGYIVMQGATDTPQGAFPWPDAFNAWKAEYFNNAGLAGKPAFVRDEPPNPTGGIGYNWGEAAPDGGRLGIVANWFSARYTRVIDFGAGGNFEFAVTCDDGFRLLWDGQNLAALGGGSPDQFWKFSTPVAQSFQLAVTPGVHTIVLEYFDGEGNAQINLDINPK